MTDLTNPAGRRVWKFYFTFTLAGTAGRFVRQRWKGAILAHEIIYQGRQDGFCSAKATEGSY
ncbi:MAG: hypothetical protein ACTS5F_01030 [Candidatus Hodgkinia cicadicola]